MTSHGSEKIVSALQPPATLQEMIRICEGCSERSLIAAESVRDGWLASMLVQRAKWWQALSVELRKGEIVAIDHRMHSRRIRGSLHRALIKIKSALNDDRAIAASCADQEALALRMLMERFESGALACIYHATREPLTALGSVELAPADQYIDEDLVSVGDSIARDRPESH